jgi:hypothetical protein
MGNYETLGKYIDAKERLTLLVKKRDMLLNQLRDMALISNMSSDDLVVELDMTGTLFCSSFWHLS